MVRLHVQICKASVIKADLINSIWIIVNAEYTLKVFFKKVTLTTYLNMKCLKMQIHPTKVQNDEGNGEFIALIGWQRKFPISKFSR